jgi:uncharacterized spore protein YtfJ
VKKKKRESQTQEKTVIPVAKVIYGFGAGALAVWTVQL